MNDYARAIRSWSSVDDGSLLVERFDSVTREPLDLLTRVLTHIGADPDRLVDRAESGRKKAQSR